MIKLILEALVSGSNLFTEKEKTAFSREYHKILKEKSEAENETGNNYYDVDIDIADEKIENLLKAFSSAAKNSDNSN